MPNRAFAIVEGVSGGGGSMTITCLLNFIGENPDPSGPSPIRVFATAPGTSSWSQAVNAVSQAVVDFYVAHGFQILARDVSVSDFR